MVKRTRRKVSRSSVTAVAVHEVCGQPGFFMPVESKFKKSMTA